MLYDDKSKKQKRRYLDIESVYKLTAASQRKLAHHLTNLNNSLVNNQWWLTTNSPYTFK